MTTFAVVKKRGAVSVHLFSPRGGRGLLLVDPVSDRWGRHPASTDEPAKIVWTELGTAQAEGSS